MNFNSYNNHIDLDDELYEDEWHIKLIIVLIKLLIVGIFAGSVYLVIKS